MAFGPRTSRALSALRTIQTGLWPTREQHYRATGKNYLRSICYQLWLAPVLNWDGRVMGCCRNFWGDFGGNAFHEGLAESLENPRLQQARKMLMGRAEPTSDLPCTTCELYLNMKKDGNWISEKELDRVAGQLGQYLAAKTWFSETYGSLNVTSGDRPCVSYFSMEFGIHESVPVYSGGLGILAGDHLKSASDLGVPLVGIGLFYSHGYFLQRLDREGWQREERPATDIRSLPLESAAGPDGQPIIIKIETRSGVIAARIRKLTVGRNTLFLLDSNVFELRRRVPGAQPDAAGDRL